MAVDLDDNLVSTGYFSGTVDFGGGPLTVNGPFGDAYVASVDADGQHRWSRAFGGAGLVGDEICAGSWVRPSWTLRSFPLVTFDVMNGSRRSLLLVWNASPLCDVEMLQMILLDRHRFRQDDVPVIPSSSWNVGPRPPPSCRIHPYGNGTHRGNDLGVSAEPPIWNAIGVRHIVPVRRQALVQSDGPPSTDLLLGPNALNSANVRRSRNEHG